jgi:endonuclease/exonuclease/phosphatase family metal-dependent hydrolase
MNFGRKMVEFLMIAANVLVAFLMIAAIFASEVSPEKFILPAYTSLILPLIIVFNIAFVVFWILFRKWFFLLSLLLLIFGHNIVSNTFVINADKDEEIVSSDSVVTLMSFNTHANDMMAKHTEENPNRIIAYMLEKDPDILCIQEYSAARISGNLLKEDLTRAFKKYKYQYVYFKTFTGWSYFGIATFSKYPIVFRKPVEYFTDFNPTIITDIKIGNDTVRVINCHLESNKLTESDKTMALRLRENLDTETIKGTTAHLSQKLGGAYKIRAQQADAVAKVIQKTNHPLIVAGDFNDVPSSYAYTKIRGDLKDAFVEKGFGLGWTFNESLFRFRIDHVFYNEKVMLNSVRIDRSFNASDHFPLITQFTINNPNN